MAKARDDPHKGQGRARCRESCGSFNCRGDERRAILHQQREHGKNGEQVQASSSHYRSHAKGQDLSRASLYGVIPMIQPQISTTDEAERALASPRKGIF